MDLLESKPDYCSNTKPLLHFLTKYLKTEDAEKLFEINISTIYKSHNENQNQRIHKNKKYVMKRLK